MKISTTMCATREERVLTIILCLLTGEHHKANLDKNVCINDYKQTNKMFVPKVKTFTRPSGGVIRSSKTKFREFVPDFYLIFKFH